MKQMSLQLKLIISFVVVGVIPLIIMNRTGSELQRPLGLVLMAGLAFSTIFTLVVLPTLYMVFERTGKTK